MVCCVICRKSLGSAEGTGAGGGEAGALESDFCSASAAGGSVCAGALCSGLGDMVYMGCDCVRLGIVCLEKLLVERVMMSMVARGASRKCCARWKAIGREYWSRDNE